MARPDKDERARRQVLAAERRSAAEQDRLDQEKREQELAAREQAKWHDRDAAADAARAEQEYADRAVRALDDLARVLAAAEESGDHISAEEVREILVAAQHPEFMRDAGWCGTGL